MQEGGTEEESWHWANTRLRTKPIKTPVLSGSEAVTRNRCWISSELGFILTGEKKSEEKKKDSRLDGFPAGKEGEVISQEISAVSIMKPPLVSLYFTLNQR